MAWSRDGHGRATRRRSSRTGFYVNLGIGIPTLVSNFIPPGSPFSCKARNGMLGNGPVPLRREKRTRT